MKKIITVVLLVLVSKIGLAQNHDFKLNIGYGLWESFHAGMDWRKNNYSIGLDFGTSFKTAQFENKYYSATIDNSFFIGKPSLGGLKTWYLNSRLIYWSHDEPINHWKVLQICPTVGKDFYLSGNLGMSIDLGTAILLSASKRRKTNEEVGWIFPVYPEIRFEIFYRL